MKKFKNKYRIESNRLQGWDYGTNALYFVTICCKDKEYFFGDIIDDKMKLSPVGHVVNNEWLKTFEMRPDMNLWMGNYIVMPNHFHAIIGIGDNQYNTLARKNAMHGRDAMHCVSTGGYKNQFGPQTKNLASIVRGFKTGVTINARQIDPDFAWQTNYHDHIIRNEKSFQKISDYIIDNPLKWDEDTFHPNNQKAKK